MCQEQKLSKLNVTPFFRSLKSGILFTRNINVYNIKLRACFMKLLVSSLLTAKMDGSGCLSSQRICLLRLLFFFELLLLSY